ncbi:MAG: UMP kinase [Planctomycetota bacterium]
MPGSPIRSPPTCSPRSHVPPHPAQTLREALGQPQTGHGMDPGQIQAYARQIARVVGLGVEVAIVCGGGNILRGAEFSQLGGHRATADYMGMLGTVINALALSDAIEQQGVDTRVMTALEIKQVAEPFVWRRADAHLTQGRVVLLAAGTGNPFFTTDTAAALRANRNALTRCSRPPRSTGSMIPDPKKNPAAKRFETLTFREVIERTCA